MPRVVGIGLVALDIVIDDDTDERLGAWAGGSCGNVLSILAWLGWDAAPVARLDNAYNADLIRHDLQRWNVDDRWLSLGDPAPAPVFIERLFSRDGVAGHRFDRFCPTCGGHLPRYQPVTRKALEPVLDALEHWDVLYIDRPSSGAVMAAHKARELGLSVVFEPSARGKVEHLAELAATADIVKYSSDRLTQDDRAAIAAAAPALEVETLGAAGLRYRHRRRDWQALMPVAVQADDTVGAGDWTTAGLLVGLAEQQRDLARLGARTLREILSFAQALAAWSCRFHGARGAMESQSPAQVRRAASALLSGQRHTIRRRRKGTVLEASEWACESCS